MSTQEQEPIPEAFEKWVDGDTKGMINPQNKAFYRQGAIAAYRHLSSQQKAAPEIMIDLLKWVICVAPPEYREEKPFNLKGFRFKQNGELIGMEEVVSRFMKQAKKEMREEVPTPSVQSKPKDTSAMGDNPLNGILPMELQNKMNQEAIRLYLAGEDYKPWEKGCEWLYWALIKGLAKENQTSIQPIEREDRFCPKCGESWESHSTICRRTPQTQPIADKEVPGYVKSQRLIPMTENDPAKVDVYMRQLVREAHKELAAARTEISAQSIQIAGLLASNKEWGEKYLAREKEVLDYRSALQNISDGCKTGDIQITSVREIRSRIAQLLDKYPSLNPYR